MHHTSRNQFVESAVTFPKAPDALKSLILLHLIMKEASLRAYFAPPEAFLCDT